MKAVADEGAAA